MPGDDPSEAQKLDLKYYAGGLPISSYVARTIFLNTLAYTDAAKGVSPEHLRFSVCSPSVEPAFVEQARLRFLEEANHLDDTPGVPLRFTVEPNLRRIIRKQMADIDSSDVRATLNERVREVFGKAGGKFNMVAFPGGPYEVPDEIGDGRPTLVVMGYEALTVPPNPRGFRKRSPRSSRRREPTSTHGAIATTSFSSWPTTDSARP